MVILKCSFVMVCVNHYLTIPVYKLRVWIREPKRKTSQTHTLFCAANIQFIIAIYWVETSGAAFNTCFQEKNKQIRFLRWKVWSNSLYYAHFLSNQGGEVFTKMRDLSFCPTEREEKSNSQQPKTPWTQGTKWKLHKHVVTLSLW